jgi:hypothetical protein
LWKRSYGSFSGLKGGKKPGTDTGLGDALLGLIFCGSLKVAASIHAQYNPNALLQKVVTGDEVLNSPMVADPLHRLDCCVVTDGGVSLVIVSPEIAKKLQTANYQIAEPDIRCEGRAVFNPYQIE